MEVQASRTGWRAQFSLRTDTDCNSLAHSASNTQINSISLGPIFRISVAGSHFLYSVLAKINSLPPLVTPAEVHPAVHSTVDPD